MASVVSSGGVSYPEEAADLLYEIEDHSFWFQHRNACILAALTRFPATGLIFDIGGGNGVVAKALQDGGFDVVLMEPCASAVRNARRRGVRVSVQARFDQRPVAEGEVAAVTLCDVLEHIDDQAAFLGQIHRALCVGGRLLLTVPAYERLWSSDDIAAGHVRRYTLGGLSELLTRQGFNVEYGTYLFQLLVPPIVLLRTVPSRLLWTAGRIDRRNVATDHMVHAPRLARLVRAMLAREVRRIAAGGRLSCGTSCLVVARKASVTPDLKVGPTSCNRAVYSRLGRP